MTDVLVLIAGAGTTLAPETVAMAHVRLAKGGAAPGEPDWLDPARACDVPLKGPVPPGLLAELREMAATGQTDVALVPGEGRRKRVLVADMDSTIVTGETLDEIAEEAGIKEHIAGITARAMNGELDFKAALRERVALLEGLSADALERAWERTFLTPGARTLVATMRAHGAIAWLVSGGFRFFSARVAALAGFDADVANTLVIEGGRLTGRVGEPILDRDAKVQALHDACRAAGVPHEAAVTIGDGANDLPMLLEAGLGIAFRAKPSVAAEARCRLDHADLTGALYLQGYRAEDLVGSEPG